ncbi:MFS transporter [Halanaerobium sp. Z-7514]|uniref:MFS transporter n=1 Tax=Halanaerobium polyolivorans TaxID=2886943 RepID=A0AAW4WZ52_9FIRM|nr:MFS transporter [Halanaerobium polyolivorans]MCC3144619.1 MFS transporter [Halanaerobium polyolivorans]RQD72064.1 MAG: MFS transporter [Halanaerobium sp. MSAO_Bac5]
MNTTKSTKLQYKFLFIISTAYLAVDINMQGFMALMPFVRDEFSITRAQAGLYSTAYFLLATLIAIYSGSVVDKIGSKKGMIFGVSSVGVLLILHSAAPHFFVLLILALLTGLVFSIITPSLNKAVMYKVSAENRATSMGIMQMGGGVGGFLGATFLPVLGEIYSWRIAVLFSGSLALIVALFLFIFYQEDNKKDEDYALKQKEQASFKESISILLKNKNLMLVCALGFALGTAVGSIPAHYTLYLTQDVNMSRTVAGLSLGFFQIGGIVGRPALGYVNDKFFNGDRSLGLTSVAFSLVFIQLFYSFYISNFAPTTYLIYFSSFLTGVMALGWMSLFFTTIAELSSAELTGIGTGVALVFLRSGVVVSPPIFGHLADISGSYQLSWLVSAVVLLTFTSVFHLILKKNNG